MDTIPMDRSIAEWNEATVGAWLASLGFPQYEQNMKGLSLQQIQSTTYNNLLLLDHKIDGEVLCRLDSEHLKEIGITSIGQRVAILKAVFHIKLAHNEPIEPGDYVPPCM
jgi:protein STE50